MIKKPYEKEKSVGFDGYQYTAQEVEYGLNRVKELGLPSHLGWALMLLDLDRKSTDA